MDENHFENSSDKDINVFNYYQNQWRETNFDDDSDLSLDMTSLGNLILLEKSMIQLSGHYTEEDESDINLQRLSLAHEGLHNIPNILIEQLAPTIKILDISHNEFQKLDFLEEFTELTYLICDNNNITSDCYLPYLPKLELLWLNHCKISDLFRWTYKLSSSCPNLKYLSLMGNPGAPFFLNSVSANVQTQYRLFILSLFPNLLHLDDLPVTEDEKEKSQKLYQKHIVDILTMKVQQNLPECLKRITHKMSLMLSTENLTNTQNKNYIV